MSDSVRRYKAIRQALIRIHAAPVKGHMANHINTLSAMISGLVAHKSVHLSRMAQAHTDSTRIESRVMKYSRFVQNEKIKMTTYFLPYIKSLLAGMDQGALLLAIDTSSVGRDCLCLMVSLVYKHRALPLCFTVTDQKKGHVSADIHVALLEQLKEILPDDRVVTLVGDGEFDSVALIKTLRSYGWHYVLRSAKDARLLIEGQWKRFDHLIPSEEADYTLVHDLHFTQEAILGPMHALCYWDRTFKDPLYLLTDYRSVDQVMACYRKRAHIETLFSDQKSRGFHIHKSHMSDPDRLQRLMMAAALAYIWIVYLGDLAHTHNWRKYFERKNRADLSLFQLGLHCLAYMINHDLPILVDFQFKKPPPKSIRFCVG